MIEFNGTMSSKCIHFYIKKDILRSLIIFSLPTLPFVILMIVLSILRAELFWGVLAGLILVVAVSLAIVEGTVFLKKKLPTQITIADGRIDKVSILESKNNPISEIETVVDYGEWYQIYFNIGFRNNYIICQKDLILKGTLEENEGLLGDKIVRLKK